MEEPLPQLPDIYNITLYRVLQEALSNIVKHAQARHVWVDLTLDEGNIILTVQDNGHGFQPGGTPSNGIGLSSMRERVTIAGGHFAISSMQKRGTIITAQFPLHPHQNKMEELS